MSRTSKYVARGREPRRVEYLEKCILVHEGNFGRQGMVRRCILVLRVLLLLTSTIARAAL